MPKTIVLRAVVSVPLGAFGGERMGGVAQEVRCAGGLNVGEDDDEIIEAEDVQPQQEPGTPK